MIKQFKLLTTAISVLKLEVDLLASTIKVWKKKIFNMNKENKDL